MRGKKIILLVSTLFYLGMMFLAVFAKKLHTASLPRVRIGYLEQRSFVVGKERTYLAAMPKGFDVENLYCLSEEERNGEIRYVVKRLENVRLGEEVGGYYPVLEGVNAFSPLIVEAAEGLTEGQEVFLENEEELKPLY